VVVGPGGGYLLKRIRDTTRCFREGLTRLQFETIPGDHPIVPLVVSDSPRTAALVQYLRDHGVLATGLAFPVVPRGSEEIRFQICADHTPADIDGVLRVLEEFVRQS
jgi:glycine C-acetyltransferase